MSQPLLPKEEVTKHLDHLPGWKLEGSSIISRYEFKDFVMALQFVNLVGSTAESVQHHPNIDIRYNKVKLVLTTHDSLGITMKDIEMAAAADGFAEVVQK